MPKYGDDLLLLCPGLQANGAQIFWDTLYIISLGTHNETVKNPAISLISLINETWHKSKDGNSFYLVSAK